MISDVENQKLLISNDMQKIREWCESLQKAIDVMKKEFVECMYQAEAKNDMSLVIKGNGLKRKCEESRSELKVLGEQCSALDEKRKKLK